jgi:hypothetical protein
MTLDPCKQAAAVQSDKKTIFEFKQLTMTAVHCRDRQSKLLAIVLVALNERPPTGRQARPDTCSTRADMNNL